MSSVSPFRWKWLAFLLFYTLLANIPYWCASRWTALLPLGWFCIEYAALGLLALLLPRLLTTILLFLLICADILSSVSKTYYLSPTECLASIGYLGNFSGARAIAFLSVALATIGITLGAFFLPIPKAETLQRWAAAVGLISFILLTVGLDYRSIRREGVSIGNPFKNPVASDVNKFSDFHDLWEGRYPLLRLTRNQAHFGTVRGTAGEKLGSSASMQSAAAAAIRLGGVDRPQPIEDRYNLVVIVLESWGESSDTSVNRALVGPYYKPEIEMRYNIVEGSVPFYGSTVSGEARELCNSSIGLQLENLSKQEDVLRCLPGHLNSKGYESVALHGMDGSEFRRATWYKTLGFKEEIFRDSFRQNALPDCNGALVGTCDAAIAKFIQDRLQIKTAKPDLIYWVTLNSHLPVLIPSGLENGAFCSMIPALQQQPAFCSWFQLVANVHQSVAEIATAHLGRPTVFSVVGDHAPPFSSWELRHQFSSEQVPYLLLIPK